jgi:hypothetical protein
MEETIPPVPEETKPEAKTSGEAPKQESPKRKISNKAIWRIILVLLFILIPLVVYFVKHLEVLKLQDQHATELKMVTEQATKLIDQRNEMYLEQIVKGMSYNVQQGLMDLDTAGLFSFIKQFIKEKECKAIILVDREGRVFQATDIRLNGELFAKHYAQAYIQSNETKIFRKADGEMLATSPVVVNDERIGTVVFVAKPDEIILNVIAAKK